MSAEIELKRLINLLEDNKIKYGTMILKKQNIKFTILLSDKQKIENILKNEKKLNQVLYRK